MKSVVAAFQFLTIIPIRTRGDVSPDDLRWSAVFFPVVGFFQGLFLAGAAFLLLKALSPAVVSALLIVIYLLTNGAFHQDGLSDTFDALAVRSTGNAQQDRDKRLAVMRDSTSGPIGITAIAAFLLLKYALFKEVLEVPAPGLNPVIILFPMISAWSMTMMMPGAKSARKDGLGTIFLGRIKTAHVVLACIVMAGLTGAVYSLSYIACPYAMRNFVIFFFLGAAASLLAGYAMRALFTARIGGLTGDNLGCIHEISEVIVLLAAVLLFKGL
jgi:adenosylcobinamide-GDP ribazoletransferase